MSDQDNKAKIIEPLAKFHARIDTTGRITIPRYVRSIFNIEPGDHVVVDIRHISVDLDSKEIFIIKVAPNMLLKVGRAGALTIPLKIREKLLLTPGDLVEIILYDVVKLTSLSGKRFKYVYTPDAKI